MYDALDELEVVPWPEHIELLEEEARRCLDMPTPEDMPYELADPICMLEAAVAEDKEKRDSWEDLC